MRFLPKKGFTLIELLVVIAIIAILASIAFVQFDVSRRKARDTGRVEMVRQLRTALELYRAHNGSYPGGTHTGADFLSIVPTYISTTTTPTFDIVYYQGLTSISSGGVCAVGAGNCEGYHMGILLEGGANLGVMLTDKDLQDVPGPGDGTTIDGISTLPGCGDDASATSETDLCYDVTP